jgi:hypothetical protein
MRILVALSLASVGCITLPHSAIVGQTAAPIAAGGSSVSASMGVGYQSVQLTEPQTGTSTTTGVFAAPLPEANVAYGLIDKIALNAHLSSAGLEPGARISLMHGPIDLVVLPSVAFGLYTQNSSSSNGGGTGNQFALIFVGGLRAIASYKAFYGAVAYDFSYRPQNSTNSNGLGGNSTNNSTLMAHSLLFNVGFDLAVGGGGLHLRPEVAFILTPGGSLATSNGMGTTNLNLFEWMIVPAITASIESPSRS